MREFSVRQYREKAGRFLLQLGNCNKVEFFEVVVHEISEEQEFPDDISFSPLKYGPAEILER